MVAAPALVRACLFAFRRHAAPSFALASLPCRIQQAIADIHIDIHIYIQEPAASLPACQLPVSIGITLQSEVEVAFLPRYGKRKNINPDVYCKNRPCWR
jgi:hypothetical protein